MKLLSSVFRIAIALSLSLITQTLGAAEYAVNTILPSQLAGKTLWLQITSKGGNAAYESAGSYKVILNANGTYTAPATEGITAKSGTWAAFKNYDVLYLDFTGWFNDATIDVFVFFSLNGVSTPAYYEIHREHLDPDVNGGNQVGVVRITDSEIPTPHGSGDQRHHRWRRTDSQHRHSIKRDRSERPPHDLPVV